MEDGIEPIAYTLDDDQRKRLHRMGLRNETFSRAALEVARQNPSIVPVTIDLTAIERDLTARDQLMSALFRLRRVTRLLKDTVIACGVDAYNGSRGRYKAMKVVAEINGMDEIVAELGERFAKQGTPKEKAPADNSTSPWPACGRHELNSATHPQIQSPERVPFPGHPFFFARNPKAAKRREFGSECFSFGFFRHEMGRKGKLRAPRQM